jgi:hypothetical protein
VIRHLLALEARITAPVPAAPMALTRMMFGALMALAWGLTAYRADIFWGPEGIAHYVARAGGSHWTEVWWPLLFACIILGGFGFTAGLFTRVSGALMLFGHVALIQQFYQWTWGWSTTIPVLVTYVVLSDAGKAWSMDAWRAGGRKAGSVRGLAQIPGGPWRLLLLNVACIYLMAGWHRIDDSSWIDGDIVWEALTCSMWSRWIWIDWNPFKPMLRFAAYAAETLEVGGAIMLFIPRVRPWWALGCIGLHIGLELTTSVGWWQWGMVTALTALLWPSVPERILCALWRQPRVAAS